MLIASLVVDDQTEVTVRPGFVDVDSVYVTPTSANDAERLAASFTAVAHFLRVKERGQSMVDPEPDGPLAAISESELRLLCGDR
jgi:hypothetical protein